MAKLIYDEIDSPIGALTLVVYDAGEGSEAALCQVEFGGWADASAGLRAWSARWCPEAIWEPVTETDNQLLPAPNRSLALPHQAEADEKDALAVMRQTKQELYQYFNGSLKKFTIPLRLFGTEFQRRVWRALLDVPYGRCVSYKDIASAIGDPKAVRAVGGANNRNPIAIIVPCHRVIGADGRMVGYGGGLSIKESLLALEGTSMKKHAL